MTTTQQGEQREDRRHGQDHPAPAAALEHQDGTEGGDRRQQQRDDEEQVEAGVGLPSSQPSQRTSTVSTQTEHGGEGDGQRAFPGAVAASRPAVPGGANVAPVPGSATRTTA